MRGLIANIIISVLALFAGFQLYQSIYPESGQPPVGLGPLPQTDADRRQDRAPDPGAIHFSNYKAIGEKNLFRPERREWYPPPQVGQPQEKKVEENRPKPPPPRLTLYGTIIYGDDLRIAIIKGGEKSGTPSKRGESYRLGDEISGYRIQEIEEERVLLARGEDIIELKLREGKPRPQVPAVRQARPPRVGPRVPIPGARPPPGAVKRGERPDRIVVKGPGGRKIVKRKKVIRTPFGPKTIYIEER